MNDSLGAIIAIVVLWAILRFAFGGGSQSSSGSGMTAPTLNNARGRQVPQHMVDSVRTLFPHISEASIRYDLQRSGSAEATCERILNEGGLPNPPAGFFGSVEPRSPAPTSTSTSIGSGNTHASPQTPNASASSKTASKSPNLISRYGLQSRLATPEKNHDASSSSAPGSSPNGWAQTPEERAKILRDRKEKMILEARQKLLEKQRSTSTTPTANPPAVIPESSA
ncbi:hypothetical protein BCV70DRAFT_201852 [Testicularia cyperi]|uniref:Coupling of ubiquitin conjugation to ER degradation protein 1 n=1 Tax=Testicularia cyperi TaxID=1882483 RepID=A0A317XJS3_9BASI|nr:hypothetical protein BCV70DRAFT_201852 [Testicularia cyperi]